MWELRHYLQNGGHFGSTILHFLPFLKPLRTPPIGRKVTETNTLTKNDLAMFNVTQ